MAIGLAHGGLVAHVLDLLADWGGVSARRMFSGHGLYRHGAIFGLIVRDTLYLRVDDRNRPDFTAVGSQPFRYRRGSREVEIRGYMECPATVLDDVDEMIHWATAALATQARTRSKKTAPKRRRRR